MFCIFVFFLSTLYINRAAAQGECTDVRGRQISHGLHYVPGPDTCSLCICDNGLPKICKAVLCSQPQDCKSFRVGKTCCEYICLDDVVKPAENSDVNVRIAAGGSVALFLISAAFAMYRLRKQKRNRAPHTDDQRSLTSIGYISGSMGYVGGNCETGLSAWKPPSNYMPRGEAPPPYDEAVAQSRAEAMRLTSETAFHRTYPTALEYARPEESLQCSGHGYVNIPRPITQVANNQSSCFNAPLLQTVHAIEAREPVSAHHPMAASVTVGFPSAIRLTGSLGTITNRGLLSLLQREPPPEHERPHNVPGFYTNTGALSLHTSLHRTIPRISTAIDTTVLDTAIAGFNRTDRSLHNEIRRSFHKPSENSRHILTDTGRSMPRNLNLASNAELSRSIEPSLAQEGYGASAFGNPGRSRTQSEEQNIGAGDPKSLGKNMTKGPVPAESAIVAPPSTLPLTVDKPSCVCSYEGSSAPGVEEADDYRSECENCKSASSSRWVLEDGWSESGEEGTQTLQRRAPPTVAPPPATATLPQPVTKQRTVGPPSNWENWFNTIPDSDTESEEE